MTKCLTPSSQAQAQVGSEACVPRGTVETSTGN